MYEYLVTKSNSAHTVFYLEHIVIDCIGTYKSTRPGTTIEHQFSAINAREVKGTVGLRTVES